MEISNFTKVVITGEDRSGGAFESLKRKLMDTERNFDRLKSVMSTLGVGLSLGGAFAFIKGAAEQFLEAEKSINRLNAVLQTTQHSAGLTANELERLTQSLSKTTLIDDEQIRDGITQMLIFKNVTGDVAKEAITLGANYAAAFGGDVASAMQNVGRALDSPADAARALRALNVRLTDSQQDLIKGFIETGEVASAQALILDVLKGKYGDLAAQINKGPLAESERMKRAWDEMLEAFGKGPVGTGFFGWAAQGFEDIKGFLSDPTIKNFFNLLTNNRIESGPKIDFTAMGERFGMGEARLAKEGAARQKATEQIESEIALYEKLTGIQLKNMDVSDARFTKATAGAESLRSKLESLLEQDAYVKLAANVDLLNKGLAQQIINQDQYNKQFDAMIAKLPDVVELNKEYIETQKELQESMQSHIESQLKSEKSYEDEMKAIKDATQALQPYSRELAIATKITELMKTHTEASIDEIRALATSWADATEKLSADTKMKDIANSIESDLTDALMRGFESGKDFAQNFRDTLINMFKTLVLRPTIQGILAPISGTVAALGSGVASAATGGGLDLSSLLNIGSSLSGAGISIGSALGMSGFATGAGSISATGGMIGTSLAGFAAAVPWLAIAAIAIPIIASLFDDGPADRTANFTTGAVGVNPRYQTSTPFGITGINKPAWFSDKDMGPALDAFIAGIAATDKQIVEQLNLSADQIADATTNLAGLNDKTYSFGTEHEGIEGLVQITQERYSAIFKAVNEDLSLLISNYDQADDKIGEYISGAVQLYKALDNVSEAMPELSKSLLAFASLSGQQLMDTAAIINYAAADPIKAVAEQARLQSRTLTQLWGEQGDALRKLVAEYDGSAAATSQLAALTQARYQTELQLAQQIMQVLDASHTMFASSAEQIRFSVLSETEKYNSLRNKSLELEGILASATDPSKIDQLAKQLNDVTTQAFGLLTAEQQKQQAEPFANYLEGLDVLVQQKLLDAQTTLSGEHNTSLPDSIASAIETAMEKAAAKFLAAAQAQQAAADAQSAAADKQIQAASAPISVNVRVTGAPATAEVGR